MFLTFPGFIEILSTLRVNTVDNAVDADNAEDADKIDNSDNIHNVDNAIDADNAEKADNVYNAVDVYDADNAGNVDNTGHRVGNEAMVMLTMLTMLTILATGLENEAMVMLTMLTMLTILTMLIISQVYRGHQSSGAWAPELWCPHTFLYVFSCHCTFSHAQHVLIKPGFV